MTAAIPTFGSVVLDCPDPVALADFYARLLDWPAAKVDGDDDGEWVTLRSPEGVLVEFQRVDDYRAPNWPGQDSPQQFHLDLTVVDMEAAHERALEIGATHLDTRKTFRVYADPAGHPFCLCGC